MRAVAIVNPTAGSGRAGKLWPDAAKVFKAAWPGLVVSETRRIGPARDPRGGGRGGRRRVAYRLPRLYSGTHMELPEVTILKGRRVTVEAAAIGDAGPILVEADGESSGQCPAVFEVLPGALELVR